MTAPEAYRDRRVLVTGGLGFMGVNLVRELVRLGAEVEVLTRREPDPRALPEVLEGVRAWYGDMADPELVVEAVAGAEVVFDLAGRSGSALSVSQPLADLADNCVSQLQLLEACRRSARPPHVVFASSRLVYAPGLQVPVPESAATAPISIYGVHKLTVEQYLRLYQRLHGVPFTVLRITNPYGPFQAPGRRGYGVVNWLIERALDGLPLPVYGDGAQLRDYLHVDDVVAAMLSVGLDRSAEGETFNVGGGAGIAFVEMVQEVIRCARGGRIEWLDWPAAEQQVETGDFFADISLIRERLGWRPQIDLQSGLERTLTELAEQRGMAVAEPSLGAVRPAS